MNHFFKAIAIAVTCAIPAQAADLVGVPKVDNGDSFVIDREKVRLFGVNAPNKRQYCPDASGGVFDCGAKSAAYLKRVTRKEEVSCDVVEPGDADTLALVRCTLKGKDLGARVVGAGYGQARLAESTDYATIQKEAFFAENGLWAFGYVALETIENPTPAGAGCDIKGNLSKTGRLYHTTSSRWYGRTNIRPEFGERWFCSEREATRAGWRAPNG